MPRSLKPYGPGTATFSPCKLWRYELTRDLSACPHPTPRAGILLAIGLNPSTATDDDDDPTIHKESGWARDWGCTLYLKANAYAFRATLPKDMFAAQRRGVDIVGPDNDEAIRAVIARMQREGGRVLAGWGKHVEPARQAVLAALLVGVEVVCVDVNQDGTPTHPLYRRPDLRPWTCPPLPLPLPPRRRCVPAAAVAAVV